MKTKDFYIEDSTGNEYGVNDTENGLEVYDCYNDLIGVIEGKHLADYKTRPDEAKVDLSNIDETKLLETIHAITRIEDIRHEMSAILIDTDEQHPMECDVIIGEKEAEGLGYSCLELPKVVSAFQLPIEGIIYFNIEGCEEPREFDDIDVLDLKIILKELKKTK